MSYHGRVKLKNPNKYKGDPNNVRYDSSWERKFCQYCDNTEAVLEWQREPFPIPYLKPTTKKKHRYYIDFWIKVIDRNGIIQNHLIEVKPFNQTKEPKFSVTPKRQKPSKAYYKRLAQWEINKAKWSAAIELCEMHGWKFTILHEKNSNFLG